MDKSPGDARIVHTYRNFVVPLGAAMFSLFPFMLLTDLISEFIQAPQQTVQALRRDLIDSFPDCLTSLLIFGFVATLAVRYLLTFLFEQIVVEQESVLWRDHFGRTHGPFRLDSIKALRHRILLGGGGGTWIAVFKEGYVKYAGLINDSDTLDHTFEDALNGHRPAIGEQIDRENAP